MHRTFCTLAMCCFLSSVGVAQVRPKPARVPTTGSAVWEYGELFYSNSEFLSPSWDAADTSLKISRVIDSVAGAHAEPGRAALVPLLNAIGSAGWLLVSVPTASSENIYIFKRRLK